MANFFACLAVFRIALPLFLTVAIIFRPCLISGIYLLFFFILPWIPEPTTDTMRGGTGLYLKILLAVSVLTTLLQLIFQIVLVSLPPYAHFLENCNLLEKILRHVGFVKLDNLSVTAICTWLSPEILMLITSIVVYTLCNKLTSTELIEGGTPSTGVNFVKPKKHLLRFTTALGKYISLMSLCVSAILRPSIPGGIYFLVFLSAATWWAAYKELHRGFAILLRCVLIFASAHFTILYAYQVQWIQELLDGDSPYARYFGLTPLFQVACSEPRNIGWADAEWASYLNPLMLLWLYYILTLESKLLLMPQLIRGVSPSRKYGAGKKTTVIQDSTGSVTVTSEGQDDIPLEHLDALEDEEDQPTLIDNMLYGLEYIIQVIIRSSYIITNIIMMAWSITFHSWLTFVLLIWANILWIVPNQRQSMLRSSPLLVFYAWFLLISGYIYSMNLNDSELPRIIDNVDLALIGFLKVTELPCKFLLVKCLYTSMFWITLRQFMKERKEARQSSALADMVAPLQITVGTATGLPKEEEEGNETIKLVGNFVRSFLMRFWIWIVAITLFTVAITGERMTGFRIIYMALFLAFILSFQLSFALWRKLMFGFWLIVILYSMLILVLVYTYQFPNIQMYWTDYLYVSKTQQEDIGLEDYGPKQLFIRLVTPTFFVIITVIQLHYFHDGVMEIYEPKSSATEPVSYGSSGQGGLIDTDSDKTDINTSKNDITEAGSTSIAQLRDSLKHFLKRSNSVINLIFIYLELHLHKIVLLVAMCLCIFDKCAIHFVIVMLIILSFMFGRPVYLFAIYSISIIVSLMLLARMVYQIQYINHDYWNVTCENFMNTTSNYTYQFNTAEWLGFRKTDAHTSFPKLVQWNIIVILAIVLWAVVLTRQSNYRISKGKTNQRSFFMFKHIKRADADKNIRMCLKYLFNFGYYKFGLEICFIATVAVIGLRLDMYAVFYAIWLCILVSLRRPFLAKVWPVYLIFIAILIPIEYAMIIGLPPSLCIEYPWDSDPLLIRVQEWAFLADMQRPLHSKKLIYDFILLLLVARQALVFRIEAKNALRDYPGGSNDSIIHHAEQRQFVIPVPDFITYSRSYLDIFKRAIFLSHMWIALAIVFLAGANRVNVFSIGYLIGSFVFLWLGSDLYLRPIPNIIRSWNWLLGYNVVVIFVKTLLELAGCLYIDTLKLHACWFVQLMAIGCTNRHYYEKDLVPDPKLPIDKCSVPYEHIGLAWDGLCFAFLIFQRRIFQSYYFFHVVDETKATTILASRGADLIEEIRHKRIRQQEADERTILEKIKAKMDRIKASQQKIQGPHYREIDNHFVDGIFKRPRYQKYVPKTYKEAIRSGDYYMFDELDDDEELDLIEESRADVVDPDDPEIAVKRGATISEVDTQETKQQSVALHSSKDLEPQPGTSKDEDISELSDPKEPTALDKISNYLRFVWNFIECSMVSLTLFLNTFSRDYRFILRVLNKEKKLLKERTNYSFGLRLGRARVWQPSGSYHTLVKESLKQEAPASIAYEDEVAEMSSVDQPPTIRLLLAMWYIVLSHSNILCYFMIFLNQVRSATFLSLPLPIMVFFWGTLSIPRPSKTFWVTIIAYTEVIVLIKCVFQFEILPWNIKQSVSPFYPPRIIGVEKKHLYALWDLLLLLIVFFHRYLLKCLGLWKSTYVPAVILPDGKYKITEGEVQYLEQGDINALNRLKSKEGGKDTVGEGGDLEQLVEESEGENTEKTDVHEEEPTVKIRTDAVSSFSKFPTSLHMALKQYATDITLFFKELLDPTSRLADDVYSYMFLCDFFNFFVILIGYSSFGAQQGDEGVSEYLEDNRVPPLFLLMLILQFALIIVDRAIFLRKQIFGKVIFQILQIILLHVWLFVLYPLLTDRGFNSVIPPQMYYMVKCFYLLISAYQIRCGYPTRILGNFLCKGYTYFNWFLFKGFLIIPFLYELRTVMDWMWTDTSMTVFDWIKMEDIFAHIYQLKCSRHVENEYPQPRGERKSPIIKYFMGGAALALMIAIIWFPLVFFSLGNAVGKPNIPKDITLDLRIGPYQPIFQMTAQSNSIYQFRDIDLQNTMSTYDQNKAAITFISNYEAQDIAAVKFSTDSSTVWSISPPDRRRLIDEVTSSSMVTVRLGYEISHESTTKEDSGIVKGDVKLDLPYRVDGSLNPLRVLLYTVLNGSTAGVPIPLPHLFPKFLKVTNKGTSKSITSLMHTIGSINDASLRNITLEHEEEVIAQGQIPREWWVVKELTNDTNHVDYLQRLPYADSKYLVMYTFNDKVFPSTLSFITAGGIIGVYTTIVLVAGRLLRGFLSGMCFKIMFEDLPNVDRILQLCYDVYLVREAGEFSLEEDLFAKLVFLFRSPETLIKWTRPKEEINDDDEEGDEQPQQQ